MKKPMAALALAAVLLQAANGIAGERRALPGVFEPEMLTVSGGELYIVEGTQVLVYSLKDLRLVRKIGGRGEGPGEFRPADFWYNTVTVRPDDVFVDGYDKCVRFSKDGRLLGEWRKPLGFSRIVPVGDCFVAVKLEHIEGDVQYHCLHLLGANGESFKELCRQESPVQQMTRKFEMIPDVLNFAVWEDKIYVEKSREGFVVEVFDSRGERLGRIEKITGPVPVTGIHRDEAVETLRTDPFIKRLGFEEFKRMSILVWPDALPAIRDFAVADGRIYVRTPRSRGGRENWLVLDAKGEILRDLDLPRVESAPLLATLNGVHYYAVHDHKLYFLKDNEETDEWELWVEEIR